MIGYVITHPDTGYLTTYGMWDRNAREVFLISNLDMAKKICKKYRKAKVLEVTNITMGKVVFRSK